MGPLSSWNAQVLRFPNRKGWGPGEKAKGGPLGQRTEVPAAWEEGGSGCGDWGLWVRAASRAMGGSKGRARQGVEGWGRAGAQAEQRRGGLADRRPHSSPAAGNFLRPALLPAFSQGGCRAAQTLESILGGEFHTAQPAASELILHPREPNAHPARSRLPVGVCAHTRMRAHGAGHPHGTPRTRGPAQHAHATRQVPQPRTHGGSAGYP